MQENKSTENDINEMKNEANKISKATRANATYILVADDFLFPDEHKLDTDHYLHIFSTDGIEG